MQLVPFLITIFSSTIYDFVIALLSVKLIFSISVSSSIISSAGGLEINKIDITTRTNQTYPKFLVMYGIRSDTSTGKMQASPIYLHGILSGLINQVDS